MALPKLVVGITQGDSNGIGYEVIIKSLADERSLDSFTPVVYGSSKLMGFYRKTLHNIESMDINVISSAKDAKQRKINLVNCLPDSLYAEPGQSTPESAKNAITALQAAVKDLKDGGRLCDIVPTMLDMMGIEKPAEMTGESLLIPVSAPEENKP